MTKLSLEFRELLAKTTQKKWIKFSDLDPISFYTMEDDYLSIDLTQEDKLFLIKAHNDFPKLLDELEELSRYKKALEKCTEQRDRLLDYYEDSAGRRPEWLDDKEIQQILEGEE